MNILPFALKPASKVLIAGAGGGFDFLCGLPLGLELEASGHDVHYANYSFTHLDGVRSASRHSRHLLEVTADSLLDGGDYFPEKYLSLWFRARRSIERPVWCLARQGVRPTLESYEYLIARHKIDAVVCVDGGVDGLFRGDEYDLATPSMDSISVISTALCSAPVKIYVCTAFGTEGAEGSVSHAQALERMSDLVREDAMLGVTSLLRHSRTGADFLDAVKFIFDHLPPIHHSIVVGTLAAAMDGQFGRVSVNHKTVERRPWVSPLTSLLWFFRAEPVARLKLFYEQAKNSETVEQVATAIEAVRQSTPVKPYQHIPI